MLAGALTERIGAGIEETPSRHGAMLSAAGGPGVTGCHISRRASLALLRVVEPDSRTRVRRYDLDLASGLDDVHHD